MDKVNFNSFEEGLNVNQIQCEESNSSSSNGSYKDIGTLRSENAEKLSWLVGGTNEEVGVISEINKWME